MARSRATNCAMSANFVERTKLGAGVVGPSGRPQSALACRARLSPDALDKTFSAVAEAHRQTTSSRTSATGRNIVSELLNIIRVDRLIAARYFNYNCWCLVEDSNLEEPDPESGAFANFANEAVLVDGEGFEPPLDLSISRFTGGRLRRSANHPKTKSPDSSQRSGLGLCCLPVGG